MIRKFATTITATGAASLALLAACATPTDPVEKPISGNAFVQQLEKIGYTTHIMPGQVSEPGSLVYVKTATDGRKYVEWVDDLTSCGMPDDVLGVKAGGLPDFDGSQTSDIGISALASLTSGTGVSGSIGDIRTAKLKVEEAGTESIRRLKVANWLTDPLHRDQLEDYCLAAIDTGSAAVIVSVAYVEKGSFQFLRDAGVKVALTEAEVKDLFKMDGSAGATTNTDGTVSFDRKIYVAYKEAFYVPQAGTLAAGDNDLPSATNDLNALLK